MTQRFSVSGRLKVNLKITKHLDILTYSLAWCIAREIIFRGGEVSGKVACPATTSLNVFLTYHPLDKMAAIFADDNFKCIFLNENDRIPIRISLKLIPRSPIHNNPALV